MGILIIDTSLATAYCAYASAENKIEISFTNTDQQKHAEWLHVSLEKIIAAINTTTIKAIACTIGPGSYTGIRIGLAAAKGLAFSWQKPLIGITVGELFTNLFKQEKEVEWICTLIDARRNEAFASVYNKQGLSIYPEEAIILKKDLIDAIISEKNTLFCGNGAVKLNSLYQPATLNIQSHTYQLQELVAVSFEKFSKNIFVNLVSIEPLYGKAYNVSGKEKWKKNE
jgi:tRNA threonylcarbamoyladenosine biosynthesis protein TsaB